MIVSLAGGYLPIQSSAMLGSAIKNIPIVGQTVGALNLAIIAGALTYGVGEFFIRHFEEGCTILNFDSEKTKGNKTICHGLLE